VAGPLSGAAAEPPQSPRHTVSWLVFFALLALAVVFIDLTAADLPPRVAAHFDAAGQPNSFLSRSNYRVFMLLLAAGVPAALVAIMTAAYSLAADFRIPNRDYWLAPQRRGRTRAFLIAHGVWFGAMLVMMMCCVHWLVWKANQQQPAHLSNQALAAGSLFLLLCVGAWIGALLFAFRRPDAG
jgi:uncharacterized membrane protein